MRIDHLIFDLDGTLVDSVSICTDILNGMLCDRGTDVRISAEDAVAFMSRGGLAMIEGLLGDHCRAPADDLSEFRSRYAQSITPRASLFEGVREGLNQLARDGFRMAICSNKPQNLCEKVLADLGIDHHFAAIVGTNPSRRSKPHSDLMDATLDVLDVEASRCIMIGDSQLDQTVAKGAGMTFLLVTYGYAEEHWDQAGVRRFERFSDLVSSLKAMRASDEQLQRVA